MTTFDEISEITIESKNKNEPINLAITEDGHGSLSIFDKDGENPVSYGHGH